MMALKLIIGEERKYLKTLHIKYKYIENPTEEQKPLEDMVKNAVSNFKNIISKKIKYKDE